MATPITVNIPHQLGRAEARRRIENGFGKITHLLPGGIGGTSTERWDGDRLVFSVATVGQTVSGVVTVWTPRSPWKSSCPACWACSRTA